MNLHYLFYLNALADLRTLLKQGVKKPFWRGLEERFDELEEAVLSFGNSDTEDPSLKAAYLIRLERLFAGMVDRIVARMQATPSPSLFVKNGTYYVSSYWDHPNQANVRAEFRRIADRFKAPSDDQREERPDKDHGENNADHGFTPSLIANPDPDRWQEIDLKDFRADDDRELWKDDFFGLAKPDLSGLADDDAEKAVQSDGEPTNEARDRSTDIKAGEEGIEHADLAEALKGDQCASIKTFIRSADLKLQSAGCPAQIINEGGRLWLSEIR